MLLSVGSKPSAARGTCNLPTSNEVAVVLAGDGTEIHEQFDVIVKSHNNKLHRVNMLNGTFEPLQFPLLFPYGELGFMEDMPLAKRLTDAELDRQQGVSTTNNVPSAEANQGSDDN